jgi:hypothetical protein
VEPSDSKTRGHHLVAVIAATIAAAAGVIATGISLTSASAASASAPLPPTSATIAQYGSAPDFQVTWVPSTLGTAATGADVQLYSVTNSQLAGAQYLGEIVCEANCTSVIFRAENYGTLYAAAVYPTNSEGTGVPLPTVPVSATNACTVGACVTFNATSSIGAVTHVGTGILNSMYPSGNDAADMTALDTNMWRAAPSYNANGTLNWSSWNVATSDGIPTTLILSGLWSAHYGGNPPTPWSNWTTYKNWVTSTVKTIVKSGEQVTYWEPYNEPGGAGYYDSANQATETTALLLQQFLTTYQAIKAADPSAAVIGPSIAQWADFPGQWGASNPMPDMTTFLNYAVTNQIKLAAISWHEIIDDLGGDPDSNILVPANIEQHVAEARQLIAARPSLGNPLIIINEYGTPQYQLIPGWDVAYLSALNDAGVNSAGRTCYIGACSEPSLDGLLDSTGTIPQNEYPERLVYASMSGNMISVGSNDDYVTGLGSYNATTGAITGLVGFAFGCTQMPGCTTTYPGDENAAPISVNVTVTVPWSSGTADVVITNYQGQTIGAASSSPLVTTGDMPITASGSDGTFTFNIPSFDDGDAYGFTVSQASS